MKKKILVTGGAGFIGSFLVDELVKRGHEVSVFDNLEQQVHERGKLPNYYNKSARFIDGDIRDYAALESVVSGSEIIFHLASAVGVGQSQYEIKRYVDVNTGGTANLLDILVNKKHSVEKFVVAASMSSYGEGLYNCNNCEKDVRPALRTYEQMSNEDWEPRCPGCEGPVTSLPIPEEAQQNINSIYALVKRDQEEMVLNIGKTYNIPAVALRYFNVYGPRQALSNPYTGVMAIFLSRLKNNNPPIVYEDGKQTRDFISVHDIVRANLMVMEDPKANYHVFNVGSGVPKTIQEVAEVLARLLGKPDLKSNITNKFRKGDVRHCYAEITKIKESINFEPKTRFEDGMKELIEWSKEEVSEDRFDMATQELIKRKLIAT